ncbi:hypothetical protein PJP13_29900, partial [Mycobacterium kansasii]
EPTICYNDYSLGSHIFEYPQKTIQKELSPSYTVTDMWKLLDALESRIDRLMETNSSQPQPVDYSFGFPTYDEIMEA